MKTIFLIHAGREFDIPLLSFNSHFTCKVFVRFLTQIQLFSNTKTIDGKNKLETVESSSPFSSKPILSEWQVRVQVVIKT